MRVLLDTHTFLWWISDDERLSQKARRTIADGATEVLFSAVSSWEIVVKAALGRLEIPEPTSKFITAQLQANAFGVLPLHLAHTLAVQELPDHHQDPFDRLLMAQAVSERIPLVSGDRRIARYQVRVIW